MNAHKIKQDICEMGRRLYNKGFAAANDGNITVRIGENEVLCTPTMHSKGFLKTEDICTMDMSGKQTTMKGAVDNLATIRAVLDELAITNAYIHADAALSGMILPFVEKPQPWDFAAGADSIAISGHKMLGSPLPSGVVLAKKSHVDRIARSIEYIGALDTTIAGSRSAIGPLFLWYRLRTLGRNGITAMVRQSLERAAYAVDALSARGIEAWRNENSVTVVFPRPPEAVMKKWILAPRGRIGHLLTMPHVTKDIVDEFVSDFAAAIAEEKHAAKP